MHNRFKVFVLLWSSSEMAYEVRSIQLNKVERFERLRDLPDVHMKQTHKIIIADVASRD